MTPAVPEIRSVPVSAITILNPRVRNRRIFDELVASIANLGLKKPITVSPREDGGYDLICGQGRLEEASYGDDVLHLVIASGYLSRLVGNPAIEQWLAARHPEILSGFRSIISVASLDAAAADGDDAPPTDEGDGADGALWPRPRPEAGPSDQIQS